MERRKILLTNKAYLATDRETVNGVGILLNDFETPLQWICLSFPDCHQQYPCWSIISAEIAESPDDSTGSFFIKDESIQILRQLGTSQNWLERKSYLFPLKLSSITDLKRQNSTIGLIKPQSISGYFCLSEENQPRQLPSDSSVELEKILYQFGYQFVDGEGINYQCPITNWEMAELYRNYQDNSTKCNLQEREQDALAKIMQKLEEFINEKDLYFILSKVKKHTENFSIVGLFHPPLIHFEQMSLF